MQGAWRAMSPAERDAYMHYVNGGSVDCYQALDRHWPASSRQWARSIVARESGGDPTAANPRSTARLLAAPQPALRVASRLGYSPSQWADPDVNYARRIGPLPGSRRLAVVAVKVEIDSGAPGGTLSNSGVSSDPSPPAQVW